MSLKETFAKLLARGPETECDRRRCALETAKGEVRAGAEKASRALQEQINALAIRASAEIDALDAAERETTRRLGTNLVADTRASLEPLVAQWRLEPGRQLATEIGDILRAATDRESAECPVGNIMPRPLHVLAFAFADALIKQYSRAVTSFGAGGWPYGVVELIEGVQKALAEPPALHAALERLESMLTGVATRETREPNKRVHARYLLARDIDPAALAAFDAAQAAAEIEHHRRTYTPPPGARILDAS
jgi:hypothetical protein